MEPNEQMIDAGVKALLEKHWASAQAPPDALALIREDVRIILLAAEPHRGPESEIVLGAMEIRGKGPMELDPEHVQTVLMLILDEAWPAVEIIREWTTAERFEVYQWARAIYLRLSSDEDIPVLPMPEAIKPFMGDLLHSPSYGGTPKA